MNEALSQIQYDANGLVPAIVQDSVGISEEGVAHFRVCA